MIGKIKNFFIGSYDELKKVIWPSRKIVINHTIIVILAVIITMIIVVAIDRSLDAGVQWLIFQK
jgi:preprotein translocase subunit SecE